MFHELVKEYLVSSQASLLPFASSIKFVISLTLDLQQPRNYIDQLEQPGGKQYNIQNFMMMYIFGSTTNTEYRTKLFDHWPTVRFLKKL